MTTPDAAPTRSPWRRILGGLLFVAGVAAFILLTAFQPENAEGAGRFSLPAVVAGFLCGFGVVLFRGPRRR